MLTNVNFGSQFVIETFSDLLSVRLQIIIYKQKDIVYKLYTYMLIREINFKNMVTESKDSKWA